MIVLKISGGSRSLPEIAMHIYHKSGILTFSPLTDTIEMKVGKQKLLRLSADIDNYSDLQLVWNPKKRADRLLRRGASDLYGLCSFTEFLASPEMHLVKFLEGEA
ncbi:hypothetical protein [Paenibacillus ihbetae]|uniref:hypothetical protein n=1 Tax=Paenibacillus ihbetae TaxID=1870820 RepID=UPI0037CCAEBD